MKTLYIECNMGAAGDMLMAALSELIPDPEGFIARMNALGLPGVRFERRRAEKCGVTGTHISVTVDGEEECVHDVEGTGNREQVLRMNTPMTIIMIIRRMMPMLQPIILIYPTTIMTMSSITTTLPSMTSTPSSTALTCRRW